MNQELINKLIVLKLVIEGYLLTKYADNDSISETLRNDGLEQRKQYYKTLVTVLEDLNGLVSEVEYAE